MKLEIELAAGTPRDRRGEVTDGLAAARDRDRACSINCSRWYPLPPGGKLVLGGFSQGAMLALDVALHRETPPDGLILMSGTLIAAAEWAPRMAKRRRAADRDVARPPRHAAAVLDRRGAARSAARAGATVDWHAFVGGHEIPALVLDAVSAFVRARAGV